MKLRNQAELSARHNGNGSALEATPNRRVYVLARKVLLRNTRIFKQSSTLTRAGYSVTVIGILPREAAEREERDGYTIIRLPLAPLYVTLPRRLRQLRRSLERVILEIPLRYVRAMARLKRRRRLLRLAFRRRRRKLVFAIKRGRRRIRMSRQRRRMRFVRRRVTVLVERRAVVVLVRRGPRRYRYRVVVGVTMARWVQTVMRRRRLRRFARSRRWRRFRYRVGRRRRLMRLRFRRVRSIALRPLRPYWKRLLPYLYALLGSEDPSGEPAPETTGWIRFLLTPLVFGVRLPRALNAGFKNTIWALQELAPRAKETRLISRLLRSLSRAQVRLLRAITEFLIARLVTFLRWFAWPLKSVAYYRSVYRLVTEELPPPAIIHANDLDTLLVGALLARRFKVRLLYDAQELYTGLHTLPWWYRKLLAIQEWVLIRLADGVTVVNDAIADVMARKYRVKIDSVVLNCPPLEEKPAAAAGARTIRQIFELPEDEIVLLYSGALSKDRGIENTVRALTELRQTSLVILGEGPLREELDDLIEDSGLEGRVFFSDFVPHAEVPRFISSADVGVIPYERVGVNHYLCSPSKLFHYIMAEVPVACSDFPFLRKVVVENELGAVFDPSDPSSIANAVRTIVNVPGAHAACRERLKVAKRRYCWEEEEKRMMRVYAALDGSDAMPAESLSTRVKVSV